MSAHSLGENKEKTDPRFVCYSRQDRTWIEYYYKDRNKHC